MENYKEQYRQLRNYMEDWSAILVDRYCLKCGIEFTAKIGEGVYWCSDECSKRHCSICGDEFMTSNLFSTICSSESASIYLQESKNHLAALERIHGVLPETLNEPDAEDESIYFIQAGVEGAIKIGRSKNVKKRVSDLQVACPLKLTLLYSGKGGKDAESELHSRFNRYQRIGEWFDPAKEILDFIDKAIAEQ